MESFTFTNSSPPSQRGGGDTRVNKHPTTVCQHRGEMFRLERDNRDQRRMNGSNGCKIVGLRRARTHQPTYIHNPSKHKLGGTTDMGSGYQHRPPQDCIEIHIQSQPRRGFYPQRTANTRHSRHHTRSKEYKGARIIRGYGKSGNDKAATVLTETSRSSTLPVGKRQEERKLRHNHRQRRPSTTKGTAQKKRENRHSYPYLSTSWSTTPPPPSPPIRKRTTPWR